VSAGRFDAILLDIDGVLTVSWDPIPGAIDAVKRLRTDRVPFRLITNTTTHTRKDLAATLGTAGFEIDPSEVVTAVVATAAYLRDHHAGGRVYLISDGDPRADLEGIDLVGPDEPAEVVVIGGAGEAFSYEAVNHAFRLLTDGAALIGMHRNMYWRTERGLELDGGAYIAGLEEATGHRAVICGKPAPEYFGSALALLGVDAERAAMVGDDVVNDVLGAQAAGLVGVLVRTGKFRPEDLDRPEGPPDHVINSIAELPGLIGP
jgi:HAD superfamily hydrolase (TIGR01458 family)